MCGGLHGRGCFTFLVAGVQTGPLHALPTDIHTMKLRTLKSITRLVGKAIGDFGLIQAGDRILVALSGGKDSWTLLFALRELQRKAPINYEIGAVTVQPRHDVFDCGDIAKRLADEDIPYWIVPAEIVDVVKENLTPGTNPCSFCARLRRGILYTFAAEQHWNKIALGHHLDDFIETLMLNLFFNGSIKGMSPNLVADDGKNRIIRPLVYVKEEMTRQFARIVGVPIAGCSCPFQGMVSSRRHWVKKMISEIEHEIPDVKANILAAMGRVRHRHLLKII
jgi:tRNA 2-thiocytidine biosynthesis protein TtcA